MPATNNPGFRARGSGTPRGHRQTRDAWGLTTKRPGWARPEGAEMFCILTMVVTHTNVYTHILNSLGIFCCYVY